METKSMTWKERTVMTKTELMYNYGVKEREMCEFGVFNDTISSSK
jgi:hypothetical protein